MLFRSVLSGTQPEIDVAQDGLHLPRIGEMHLPKLDVHLPLCRRPGRGESDFRFLPDELCDAPRRRDDRRACAGLPSLPPLHEFSVSGVPQR
mgnify:CR=1 FL=1